MHTIRRLTVGAAVSAAALGMTASAFAAAPATTTRTATAVRADRATLRATIDAQGLPTTYYFEYGTTRRYGSRTGDASAGRSGSPRNFSSVVSGLRPNTVYNFRVVASNRDGVTSGGNQTFRTDRQPLGLQIVPNPNPVTFGFGTTVGGTLTGTGNSGRQVVLQQRAFPFTSGFADVGAPVTTDRNGAFTFPALALPATTQLRARTGSVTSEVATVSVAVRVETRVSSYRVRRNRRVRFSGVIRPGREGALYAVQKLGSRGRWVTVAGGITRGGNQNFAGFSRRIRVRRGGQYRIFVRIVDGNYTSGIGRTVRIRTRR
jgi:hypothetical protein